MSNFQMLRPTLAYTHHCKILYIKQEELLNFKDLCETLLIKCLNLLINEKVCLFDVLRY